MEEKTRKELELENEELRERLREAQDVLQAIQSGQVDALAVSDGQGERIYTLEGADRAYRTLIETMSEGALTLSSDGTILYANYRMEEMLKAALSKVVGSSLFDFVFPEDQKSLEALLIKAAVESARGEIRLRAGNGSVLPVRVSLNGLELPGTSGFCMVLSDLSEEKRVQEELRTYSTRLEVVNRELQEFVHVATHDLQEPLRKIQTFSTRIRSAVSGDQTSAETLDDLDRMQKSAKRMQDLIRAFLSYSHVFRVPETLAPVDLNDLVLKVQEELSAPIKDTEAEIKCWDLPCIQAEPGQMHRLFRNLLENALKFRRGEPPLIKIYAEQKEGAARIFIEDNGMGLDESLLGLIFKPFQQLHRRDAFEGTGIGLAVCRKIVESHGGSIMAESTPGSGSRFIVTLPLKQPALCKEAGMLEDCRRTRVDLLLELHRLRERLREAEDVIQAIKEAKIDALVSCEPEGERVYTLKSADRGYRLLVESMNEGALILAPDGSIYYSNPRFEEMIKKEPQEIASSSMLEYLHEEDREEFKVYLEEASQGPTVRGEIRLKAGDGALLPVQIRLCPFDMEGFRGLCVTLTDPTERVE